MSIVALKDLPILPPKRPRENITFSKVGVSRCGEIYVTNNADSWTFFCSYCQKATNDIGVFICHIRLDHINNIRNTQPQKGDILNNGSTMSEIGKSQEENIQISVLNNDFFQSDQSMNETLASGKFPNQNETQVDMTIIKEEYEVPEISNFDIQIEKPLKDIAQPNMEITSDDSKLSGASYEITNEKNSYSISNENNDDQALNIISMDLKLTNDLNIEIKSRSNANKTVVDDDPLKLEYNYFQKAFNSMQGEQHHVAKTYDGWKDGFRNESDLQTPQKAQVLRKEFKCPICSFSEFRKHYYMAHVMTHEHDKYFPCQICAKVFSSSVEREDHYRIHRKERPHVCNFCCKSFYQKITLMKHLKAHDQYKCCLCPNSFYANQILEQPYICQSCKKNPNLKSMIDHYKSLANK